MGPVMAGLATIARDTGAALILIHHQGGSDKPYRGSTAIWDQSDALLSLQRGGEDGIVGLRVRGDYGRMKFAPTPADRWLKRDPFTGRLSSSSAIVLPPAPKAARRDEVKAEALAALPAKSMREVARRLDRHEADSTLMAAWRELRDDGEIVQINGAWTAAAATPTLGFSSSSSAPHSEIVDAEPVCDCDCGARLTQTPRGLVCIGCASRRTHDRPAAHRRRRGRAARRRHGLDLLRDPRWQDSARQARPLSPLPAREHRRMAPRA